MIQRHVVKHTTHPWFGPNHPVKKFSCLYIIAESERERDEAVKTDEASGWTVWISGHCEIGGKRTPAAMLYHGPNISDLCLDDRHIFCRLEGCVCICHAQKKMTLEPKDAPA